MANSSSDYNSINVTVAVMDSRDFQRLKVINQRYRKTPGISRASSRSRTPTFEFWAGFQSPGYVELIAGLISQTVFPLQF